MEKKELRRKLKLALIKSIEETLNKSNADATKKIREVTIEVSKKVAKKFYKAMMETNEESVIKDKAEVSHRKTQLKKSVLPPVPTRLERAKKIVKSPLTKATGKK